MIIQDGVGSVSAFNSSKQNHPILIIPIDVFYKPITLLLNDNSLYMVLFADAKKVSHDFQIPGLQLKISEPRSHPAGVQLLEYFEGKRFSFDLPLKIFPTSFQKSVWNVLSAIPYGQTLSYAQVAEKIQNPRAYRAVGTSCGANPLPIIIPCHRVLASDGSLGGYSGGLEIKRALLAHEQQMLNKK